MKRIGLILFVFICFSSAGFCDNLSSQSKFSSKINLQGASVISAKANGNSSFSSPSASPFQDPIVNSMLQGYGNMLQGGNTDARAVQEQAKQQLDYAKQQMQYAKD